MASSSNAPQERDVMWKVTLRLIPFLFLLYVVNILDRINVGFAKLKMLEDLNMDGAVYGLGAGIFFIGYFVFEVPSNLIMRRTGARTWMARIMISWGLISMAMMFVRDAWSFYLLRFLLGLAEAGFFPGMILYLSYWFPARERSRAVSRFMTASPIAGVLGNPISGAILQYMDGAGGLPGWQWLFLIEGLPAVLLGVAAWLYLTDKPEQAHWLEPEERGWLAQHMSLEEKHREERHGFTLLQALSAPRVWLLSALYFTVAMCANTFGLYLPTIVDQYFQGRDKLHVGLIAAVPSMVAVIAMVLSGMHSDRTGERRWHVAVPAFVAAAGWAMIGYCQTEWQVLLALTLAQVGMMSMLGPFWTLPTSFLHGAAAAGGIALINSLGNLGGFVGPLAISQIEKRTGSLTGGLLTLGATLLVGGFLALLVRHDATLDRLSAASLDPSSQPNFPPPVEETGNPYQSPRAGVVDSNDA